MTAINSNHFPGQQGMNYTNMHCKSNYSNRRRAFSGEKITFFWQGHRNSGNLHIIF